MAGTTTSNRQTLHRGSIEKQAVIEHNKLVDDIELLRAAIIAIATKLDADAGVTDTNYAAGATAVAIATAGTLTAAKLGNIAGTAITAQ